MAVTEGRFGRSMGRSALFLTAIGAVSQVLGFVYRVVVSRLVGAEVMGLYQILMPAYSVLVSLCVVGLTAAVSNLTARYLALGNQQGALQTRNSCLKLLVLLVLPTAAVVLRFSDEISVYLLGDARTQLGLMLILPCVLLTGVENIHKHACYGAGKIRTPAVVDLLEQLVRTGAVLGLLIAFLPQYPERALGLIVAGMVICEVFSSVTLSSLVHIQRRGEKCTGGGESVWTRLRKIASIAGPVGLTALLGNLIGAANAAALPQKLVAGGMERSAAMAQFGVVCGMTLPMLALPTVFLGALNLVMTPRLSRLSALGRHEEIRCCVARCGGVVSLLTMPIMAMMVVLGPGLGQLLFQQPDVGEYLIPLAAAAGMNCYACVLDGVLHGLNRQKERAVISLACSAGQLAFTLWAVPMPGVGMAGYAAGMVVCSGAELMLLLWRVYAHTGLRPDLFSWVVAPGLSAALAALTGNLLLHRLAEAGLPFSAAGLGVLGFSTVLYLAALQAQSVDFREILRNL